MSPLSVPLTDLFSNIHQSYHDIIQSYVFIEGTLAMEDDKEIDIYVKRGFKIISLGHDRDSQDWFNLFENAFISLEPEFTEPGTEPGNGDDLSELGLNFSRATLLLFDHSVFDGEGNLFPSSLSVAWLGATSPFLRY
jgi:hypothetical protein